MKTEENKRLGSRDKVLEVPFLLYWTRGMDNSETYVQDTMFLKNKPWYQRVRVFLGCGATQVCATGEREAGLSALEVDAVWQHPTGGLFPTALLGTSPPGDGYVAVWREAGAVLEVWPSCLVPVLMSAVRKQRQNPSVFGQSCPYLTMKAWSRSSVLELYLFFQKGIGLSRSLVP